MPLPSPAPSLSRRGLLGAGGLGLLALTFAGCSSRATVADTGAGTSADAAFSVTDMRGVTVSFDAPVQRIATTVIPSPSMIAAVDGGYERIVGINESTLQANQQGLFGEIFPESRSTTTIAPSSFTPNIETITDLAPDVVFQWADQGDGLVEPLENAASRRSACSTGPRSISRPGCTCSPRSWASPNAEPGSPSGCTPRSPGWKLSCQP